VLRQESVRDLVPGLVNTNYFHDKYAELLKKRLDYGWALLNEIEEFNKIKEVDPRIGEKGRAKVFWAT